MNNLNGSASAAALLIVLLPFLGFAINGLAFRKIGKGLAGIIGSLASVGSFVCAYLLYQAFVEGGQKPLEFFFFQWISVPGLSIDFSFLVDQLTLVMLFVITGVGSLIHLYSAGYMHHDEGFGKFFAFLNLFLFSMLMLVLGSNYVIMFIGWEGVGLCSFLLIGFWNKNKAYNSAARKAFVMNRIGDLGFLLGIFFIIALFGTTEYSKVFEQASGLLQMNSPEAIAITMLLFVGAMGKSAQIPLYTWLPDAMAGPTPVSALIHAATMVTAGIYMIVRSNVLYALAPTTLEVVGYVGVATALMAASIGLFQNDIKKVLAYSTVSQLGYMFLALGVGGFTAGVFHLVTHAFFKALLFLGAGSVIHAMSDEQDIRNMGGLAKKLPITFTTFLIATIAISGIPPFAGFFSKDEILAHVHQHSTLMWVLGLAGSAMTSFYMFRLLFLTFFGKFRGTHEQEHHLHESPLTMTLPLMVLAVLSIIGGFIGLPEVFSEHHALKEWLAPVIAGAGQVNPELFAHAPLDHSQELTLMGISVAVALLSLVAAYVVFVAQKSVPEAEGTPMNPVKSLIYNKFKVDELYDTLIVKPVFALSHLLYGIVEFLIIDLIVNLIGRLTTELGSLTRRLQTGAISSYVLVMVMGLVVILFVNLMM